MPNTTFNVTIFKFTSSPEGPILGGHERKNNEQSRLVIICVYQNS